MFHMSYLKTLKQTIFNPINFFGGLKPKKSFNHPIRFLFINILIREALGALVSIFQTGQTPMPFLIIGQLVLTVPIISILFILATILVHFITKALGGKAGFKNSLRVVSYGSGPVILTNIPLVAPFAFAYQIFLTAVGLYFEHKKA